MAGAPAPEQVVMAACGSMQGMPVWLTGAGPVDVGDG